MRAIDSISFTLFSNGKIIKGRHAELMMRVSVHGLTTYLAVVSVFCFWAHHFFWGVAFAVGAALQFLYLLSVFDRYH
jgi:hypothetical protein